jgi:putative flippase GtrA
MAGWLKRLYAEHGDKIRYLITGVFNTAFGYGMFVGMLALVGPPLKLLQDSPVSLLALVSANYFLIAQWTSWVLAVPVGTLTMKHFAFRSKGRALPEIFRAYFVYLPGLGISSVLLWFTVRVLHLPPELGQIVTIFVATVFSYLGHKYFTFRVRPEAGDAPEE